ncbi:glycosyltransferase [Pseudomonas paraversuta]|uniref:glycosyltransferase n=1 Tax=Pseudomonas paraversuta TaxID=2750624 RepID=UPI0019213AD0|nr:glycosyltransferase [Pseudomonas paraversuta]
MKEKIAILLATYNGSKYLEEQLISIIAQANIEWHLFVRDDGSTDNTVSLLRLYADKHENITIVDNFGEFTGSAAGNFFKLIHFSDYLDFTHISFADQDDIWSPGKLRAALDCMALEGAGGYSSNLVSYDNVMRRASYIDKSQAQKDFDYLFQGASAGCTYVITQEVCALIKARTLTIDSFKGRSHDWLIYAICRVNEVKWALDREAHIFYRQHATNVYGSMSAFQGLVNRIKLLRSGWYRNNVLWVADKSGSKESAAEIVGLIERNGLLDKLKLLKMTRLFRRGKKESYFLKFIILFLFK